MLGLKGLGAMKGIARNRWGGFPVSCLTKWSKVCRALIDKRADIKLSPTQLKSEGLSTHHPA